MFIFLFYSVYGLHGYWGQNKAQNMYTDMAHQEQDLVEYCKASSFKSIHLAYMRDFLSSQSLPSIDFGHHCSFPQNVPDASFQKSKSGFTLLKCPKIAEDIKVCQSMGVKINLAVSSMTPLNESDAETAALNVWNLFFGGKHNLRPFGDANLDGIDLIPRTDNYQGLTTFLIALKKLSVNYPLRVIVSPRCEFPDVLLGPYPNRILSNDAALKFVDVINPFFTSTQLCTFGNQAGFWETVKKWTDFCKLNSKVFTLTVPGYGYGNEAFFEAMENDFIKVEDLGFIQKMPSEFKGIGVFDVSTEFWSQPCQEVSIKYAIGSTLTKSSKYSEYLAFAMENKNATIVCKSERKTESEQKSQIKYQKSSAKRNRWK